MLVLTFSTGIIDALGYLGLDRVFTANMTGNVVILGMGLAGADDLPVVGPVIALVFFMAGAVVGGRALRRRTAEWTVGTTGLLIGVGIVLAVLGVVLVLWADPPEPALLVVTAVLALVMGMQAAAARGIAVKDVTTVVVTSTITGLSMDSRLAGGTGSLWARRILAVILILLGALVGALLLKVSIGLGLLVPAVISIVVGIIGHRLGREDQAEPDAS